MRCVAANACAGLVVGYQSIQRESIRWRLPIHRAAPDAQPWHAPHPRLHPQTTGAIRQKYVEKDHLAFRYTCLDWLRGLAWNDKVSQQGSFVGAMLMWM